MYIFTLRFKRRDKNTLKQSKNKPFGIRNRVTLNSRNQEKKKVKTSTKINKQVIKKIV